MVTRTETPHVVPLARQAVEILREVHSLTGHGRYVFPNARYPHRERPMSHGTLWSAFRALDIPRERMTMHGFRAMARAILDEVLGFRPDFIEHQLAHAVRDPNGRAYNRTAFLPERRVMMQDGARWLRERDKASVRAKVEHPFLYVKRHLCYRKVRYRGLAKNTERIALLRGFANLLVAGRYSTA